MTKVRDFIEDAEGSYSFTVHDLLVYDDDAMRYFKSFDPEHVALMETVVEAANYTSDELWVANGLHNAVHRLREYRREHGLV